MIKPIATYEITGSQLGAETAAYVEVSREPPFETDELRFKEPFVHLASGMRVALRWIRDRHPQAWVVPEGDIHVEPESRSNAVFSDLKVRVFKVPARAEHKFREGDLVLGEVLVPHGPLHAVARQKPLYVRLRTYTPTGAPCYVCETASIAGSRPTGEEWLCLEFELRTPTDSEKDWLQHAGVRL